MAFATVVHEGKSRKVDFERGDTVEKVLRKAGINPQIVIASIGKDVVADSEAVSDGDRIVTIKAISGG